MSEPVAKETHSAPVYVDSNAMDWETLRFPGQHSKMVFHPRPENPT